MRGLSRKTLELLNFAYALLEALHPMTLRQLHYAIFSAAMIAYRNEMRDYRRLSRVTTDSRDRYREAELTGEGLPENDIPPEWIVDEGREPETPNVWDDASGYVDAIKASYHRNYWQDQPAHPEVWSEKGTVLASLRPITKELGITLRVCHGFGSAGMRHQIGRLFEDIQKPIHVFYLGDHDPSGRDIERDIHQKAQRASGKAFTMTRLAIHPQDIERFHLPPQKIKPTDSRSAGFQRRYGKNAPTVELDALPVEELRDRVRSAVEGLIDFRRWNRQVEVEKKEMKSILDLAARIKALPPAQAGFTGRGA